MGVRVRVRVGVRIRVGVGAGFGVRVWVEEDWGVGFRLGFGCRVRMPGSDVGCRVWVWM